MSLLAMLFAVLAASLGQALVPSWDGMAQAKAPVLLGVALYYALYYDRRLFIGCAVVAGLMQDALGIMPLGYSSFCFCVACLVAARFKDLVFIQASFTHITFGALSAGAVNLMLYALLYMPGTYRSNPSSLLLKMLGAMLLGAVVVPLVMAAMRRFDRMLGNPVSRIQG